MIFAGVLIMVLLAALLAWELFRNHNRRMHARDIQLSRAEVVREIKQIEIHRPHHILRGDDDWRNLT